MSTPVAVWMDEKEALRLQPAAGRGLRVSAAEKEPEAPVATPEGRPREERWRTRSALFARNQMGAAERLMVAAGTPPAELRNRAGQAVVSEIERRWSLCPVTVLCGPGNNGGDGLVTALRLAEAGWSVRVALLCSPGRLPDQVRHLAESWPGALEPLTPAVLDGAQLVVDALFGAGLDAALTGPAAETLAAAARRRIPIVAIDVPSGLRGDTGEVVVAELGLLPSVVDAIRADTFENDPALWLNELPWPQEHNNKYSRGHALIAGGYPMTGAARMAARAADRSGAGPGEKLGLYGFGAAAHIVAQIAHWRGAAVLVP